MGVKLGTALEICDTYQLCNAGQAKGVLLRDPSFEACQAPNRAECLFRDLPQS